MATNHKELIHVGLVEARRDRTKGYTRYTDYKDGWERGYYSPYPIMLEEDILENIAKVSKAFVEGYYSGQVAREDEERHEQEIRQFDEDGYLIDQSGD